MRMLDSIFPTNLPDDSPAYLGYVNGEFPTANELRGMFPHAHILTLTVFPGPVVADGCDCETSDLTTGEAADWVKGRLDAGQWRPVAYTGAANARAVIAALAALGIYRDQGKYRLLTAHYGEGKHICGPDTCGYPQADGTQWTDKAEGVAGALIDESLLGADFFTPPPTTEDPMFVAQINPAPGDPTPLALPDGVGRLRFYSNLSADLRVNFPGAKQEDALVVLAHGEPHSIALNGALCVEVYREDEGPNEISCAGY